MCSWSILGHFKTLHWTVIFVILTFCLQTPPLPLTGSCPPTTTATPWSTAAPTSACCTWTSPGSWAGSPPCPRRPWRSCTAPCPPSESEWTSCSPPTRMQLTAALCSDRDNPDLAYRPTHRCVLCVMCLWLYSHWSICHWMSLVNSMQ